MASNLLLDNLGKKIIWKLQKLFDLSNKEIADSEFKSILSKNDINTLTKPTWQNDHYHEGFQLDKDLIQLLDGDIDGDYITGDIDTIDKGISFRNQLIDLRHHGLYKEIAYILNHIDFNKKVNDSTFLISVCEFATMLAMGKTLKRAFDKISSLNTYYYKDSKIANYINCSHFLSKVDNESSSALMIEALTQLYQDNIDITKYCFDYDEEQGIFFVDFTVSLRDNSIDVTDLDINLKNHLVDFTAGSEINDDNIIISISPYSFKPYTGAVI